MELEELKTLWIAQDKKLDKSLQLNLQLLRRLNFDKVAGKANTILVFKILETILQLVMQSYLVYFFIKYLPNLQFSIPALITIILIGAGIISDIRQMTIIVQLRSGNAAPVSVMQKKVEKLKLLIVAYVKWAFISIPLYPLLLILAGKIFLNVDFWAPQHRTYLTVNMIIGVLLIPGFVWIYRQLSKQTIEQRWIKNILTGSGWNQAVSAQQFLDEIEKFEQGE
jgi:hypothetical protein